jgi:hypothetical protein
MNCGQARHETRHVAGRKLSDAQVETLVLIPADSALHREMLGANSIRAAAAR